VSAAPTTPSAPSLSSAQLFLRLRPIGLALGALLCEEGNTLAPKILPTCDPLAVVRNAPASKWVRRVSRAPMCAGMPQSGLPLLPQWNRVASFRPLEAVPKAVLAMQQPDSIAGPY